ncbi:hypothetical protein ACWGB8_16365 [Kitasatospora sp. NPDC054939]
MAPDPRDGDRVVMAHPFASVPLGFSVMGAHTLWWGGCAWDSGRLDPGYTRRDLATAAASFAEVGLHGSFCGLPDPGPSRPRSSSSSGPAKSSSSKMI